jgi:hypothetical protein
MRASIGTEIKLDRPGGGERGVGLGVGNEKMRKLQQYQYVCAEPPKADIAKRDHHVRFVRKADKVHGSK